MENKSKNVHHHFASFFKNEEELQPFAYAASKSLAEGSICIDTNEEPTKLLQDYKEDLKKVTYSPSTLRHNSLVGNPDDIKKPFVLHNDNFYITRYFNYETQIIEGIKSLIELGKVQSEERFRQLSKSKVFQKLIDKQEVKKGADWQLVATAMAFVNNFSIITGGPGTGKTTTVAKVLSVLLESEPDLDVKLAAPTGKAAMRMKEALDASEFIPAEFKEKINELKPFTIHRLLGTNFQSPYFKHNFDNPVVANIIIVDEASMIDVALFSKLISAIGKNTKLILLGDQNQLASVEAGSLLGDLCKSVPELNHFSKDLITQLESLIPGYKLPESKETAFLQNHITQLKYSWRFEQNPEFRKVSEAVIKNDQETLKSWFGKNKLNGKIQIDPDYDEKRFQQFISTYEEYIKEEKELSEESIAASIEKFNSLRILAVIRNGKYGVDGLNIRVEKYLASKGLINTKKEFYEHRPVIVTRNHPEFGLFNGDIGIVRKDPDRKDKKKIFFLVKDQYSSKESAKESASKTSVIGFSPALLTDVETVYAMTVHKSQGSEFEKVLMVMPKAKELPLLTRELLYTGITRAKMELLIQGTEEVVLQAAMGEVKRASGITNRI